MDRFVSTRSAELGPEARPVAIPDDVEYWSSGTKADGVVELPAHIRWSGPPRRYDMSVRRDRCLVYELVLTEGSVEDIRRFVDLADLLDVWDELVLPNRVRRAWSARLMGRRGA